ncbi:hypothetical protein [Konateibacter massiliensis]|uniref:hypothetical protein n=1 Tax=Konateibacter massiliensis TaxID=2002841 RepID=UPI000C152746|nr:hypothetical protein [Konateibacter massiliensis]
MDKFFDFVKNNPAVIALIPASIQAVVSLLTFLKRKNEIPKATYSNINYGNQINAGTNSQNTINDYSNSGNTTINNNHTNNTSSNTSGYDAIGYLLLFFFALVIVLCFYLQNKDIILSSVFILVFSFYIFNFLSLPKSQQLIIKTIIYVILTALCYFLISYNYFKPNTFDSFVTQINNTPIFIDKCILVKNNGLILYYICFQIGALLLLSVTPLYNIMNNIKFLTSSKPGEYLSPTICLSLTLILLCIPAILPYFISTW